MSTPVQRIINDFYHATWDLSERLAMLPIEAYQPDSVVSPNGILQEFKQMATPFMGLTGSDIPQSHHVLYDGVDTVLRETVIPSLEIISEEWDKLKDPQNSDQESEDAHSMLVVGCVSLINELEMFVIPSTSFLCRDFVR